MSQTPFPSVNEWEPILCLSKVTIKSNGHLLFQFMDCPMKYLDSPSRHFLNRGPDMVRENKLLPDLTLRNDPIRGINHRRLDRV